MVMGRITSVILSSLSSLLVLLCICAASPHEKKSYSQEVCEPKFWAQSQTHTACLIADGTPAELDSADRRLIVELHNMYRGTVEQLGQPMAADMQAMVWDDELAALASRWISLCLFEHDRGADRNLPGAYEVGQNLAMGQASWSEVVTQWWREGTSFAYGSREAEGFNRQSTGHYVQVVWATASRVGCASNTCAGGEFFACNYANAVGIGGQRWTPYQQGPKGSACPDFYNTTTGLCDCKGKICKNDGVLDLKTCQCRCSGRAPWLDTDDCSVNCRLAQDRKVCATQGGAWNARHCQLYSNIKYDFCPTMCGLCPAVAGSRPGQVTHSGVPLPSIESTATATPSGGDEEEEDETDDAEGDDTNAGEDEAEDDATGEAETEGDEENDEIDNEKSINSDGEGSSSNRDDDVTDDRTSGSDEEGGDGSDGDGQSDDEEDDYSQNELPRCAAADRAACIQIAAHLVDISGAGSSGLERCQWPDHGCPAMCGQCAATTCQGSDGLIRFIGDTWLTSVGLHSCSEQGVSLSKGCVTASRASIIPIGELKNDTWNGVVYSCVCNAISSELKLSCTPLGRSAAAAPLRPSGLPGSTAAASAAAVTSLAPATASQLTQQQHQSQPADVRPCLHKDPPFCGSAVFARTAPHVRCGSGTRCPAACGHCQSSDGHPSYSAFLSEPPLAESTPTERLLPAGRKQQHTGPRGGTMPSAGRASGSTAASSSTAAPSSVSADDSGRDDSETAGGSVAAKVPLCSSGPEVARCGQPSARGFFLHAQCKHATVRHTCPAMCGLCRATQCLDYSNRKYSIGETWVSDFAQLQCTPSGVKAEKGCFFAQLRQFILAGTAKNYTDGMLHFACSCRVDDDETTLECTRTLLARGSAVQLPSATARPPHVLVTLTTLRMSTPRAAATDMRSTSADATAVLASTSSPSSQTATPSSTLASASSPKHSGTGGTQASQQRLTQRSRGDARTPPVVSHHVPTAVALPGVSINNGPLPTTRGRTSRQPSSAAALSSLGLASPSLAADWSSSSPSPSPRDVTDFQSQIVTDVAAVTTAAVAVALLPSCERAEEAKCGQPSASGYYAAGQCRHPSVSRLCPAMCDKCQATACKDYTGASHPVGQSWVSVGFGRMTCTGRGVAVEDGCYFKSRDAFIPISKSYEYTENGIVLVCHCERVSTAQLRLSCKTKTT